MTKLALAIAFLAVFGLVGYAIVVKIMQPGEDKTKPKKK